MAKIMAFGDSFTWGSDLADADAAHYSKSTWQSLLADDIGLEYVCLAEPGCSNQSIVRRFFENVNLISPHDIVILGFTWRDRYDFYDDIKSTWETVRPSGTEGSQYHKLYYKNLHNSTWDQVESLKAINLIIDYLKLNNIDFIATCIDDMIYNDPYYNNKLMTTLQNIHGDDIVWFEGTGFYQWSKDNNFKISLSWHPLEMAHDAAFQYLKHTGIIDELTE
jgi:hypothetical protein